jgi:hypothetical protein
VRIFALLAAVLSSLAPLSAPGRTDLAGELPLPQIDEKSSGRLELRRDAEIPPAAPPKPASISFKREADEAFLESEIKRAAPAAMIVEPGKYTLDSDGTYWIDADLAPLLKGEVYIKHRSHWIEPLTPPASLPAPKAESDQLRLLEVRGEVKILRPGEPETAMDVHEGMLIPTGSSILTGDNSSTAVFLGGVNSVRFGPRSEGLLRQTIESGKRSTTIDLRDGTVFSRVGRRPGEQQEFQVRTPLGIAAARGTDYAVWLRDGQLVVCSAAGTIDLRDPRGQPREPLRPPLKNDLAFQAYPSLSDTKKARWLFNTLQLVETLNVKAAALQSQQEKQKISVEEAAWLRHLQPVTWIVRAKRAP